MARGTGNEEALSLAEALEKTLAHINRLQTVELPLQQGTGRVVAAEIRARVDSPSMDTSLMDGYAVRSGDLFPATEERPVRLVSSGMAAAGNSSILELEARHTIRVMTGAPVPAQADAVVPDELATPTGRWVHFCQATVPGRHVLPKGSDVAKGGIVAKSGDVVTPGRVGLLTAAGLERVPVVRPPVIAIVATGDEVVPAGKALPKGKLYASNAASLEAWCRQYGFQTSLWAAGDDSADLLGTLKSSLQQADAVITSGGAWFSERDLVSRSLGRLGWRQVFHGIRMRPGKGVGFGILEDKPIFLLPGTPSAGWLGFLQIVRPGLLRMAGYMRTGLPEMTVCLSHDINDGQIGWTRFFWGSLTRQRKGYQFQTVSTRGRLQAVARADALVALPEGKTRLSAGSWLEAQILGLG